MTDTPDRLPETDDHLEPDTLAIRTFNDQLRTSFSGGRVMMTQGVNALADATIAKVLRAVREFDDFSEDNDPYGTHEFGMLEIEGERVMFKIDAYDQNLEYGSPNPADPSVTTRVLTILLASEY